MQIKNLYRPLLPAVTKTLFCGALFKTWSNFFPLPRARYKTISKFRKNLIHLLKFTCCKQDLHWRSLNLGQEVLKKICSYTQMLGCRWAQPPRQHIHVDIKYTACFFLCRNIGVATLAKLTNRPNSNKGQDKCFRKITSPREDSQWLAYASKHNKLQLNGNTQLQVLLFCQLIKMLLIKSRKMGYYLGWNTHYPVHNTLGKLLLKLRSLGTSPLFYRQHLLTVSQYIHSVQCLFKQLSKYIKDPQPVNRYVEKKWVPTKKDFNNHLSISWIWRSISKRQAWFQDSEERNGGQGSGTHLWQRLRAAKQQQLAAGFRVLAGTNLTLPQKSRSAMTALETVQVNFPAAWRTEASLKRCKDQRTVKGLGNLVWPLPYDDAAILKEDSCHCSHGEERLADSLDCT